jgi:acyl-coenzyme A synthetase/AMP-(fatty) acid ligase
VKWFPDGECNISFNCLDRWVEAEKGEKDALCFDSAFAGIKGAINYDVLL